MLVKYKARPRRMSFYTQVEKLFSKGQVYAGSLPVVLVSVSGGCGRQWNTPSKHVRQNRFRSCSTSNFHPYRYCFYGCFGLLAQSNPPIESASQAWLIGLIWLCLTIAFEFGFGHFVVAHPWNRLFADYDLLSGRVWSVFLLWILFMPRLFYRFA